MSRRFGGFNPPATLRLRNGKRRVVRTAEGWQRALDGHREQAHGGKLLKDCAACRELQRGIEANK